MNIIFKPAIVLTTLLTLSGINAHAAENNAGIIHFTGEIIEPSCEIQGTDGPDSTVKLGTYLTSAFDGTGAESDLTPFTITLVDCPVTSAGLPAVQLTFTGVTTLTNSTSLLDVSTITTTGTTAATGVGIAVSPEGKDTQHLTFDGAEGQVYIDLPAVAGDIVEAKFNARYQSFADAVTAGPADADMTVNIVYR
ncbi:fimbrial protein [Scandinavium goeteborgense]|uniref:Type 1 fimbrial protein n=1 Tax=Scandinavium goeteborgense TaxID=1851514 RepID=A0A4R6EP81_SCAGO|nr:fimbrial protein [Scandinavium goeteborgense]TDN59927.1 type 1 fimbrial protein [Scandinavium goeteborgense]